MGPSSVNAKETLQKDMIFSDIHAIWELIFAAISYHPYSMYGLIKLSQYTNKQVNCYYAAVKWCFNI